MTGIHGILLMATGVVHVLFGLLPATYLKDWAGFSKKRFWNQVLIHDDRKMAAFWFVVAGPLFLMLGFLLYTIEVKGLALPVTFGWMMFVVALLGSLLSNKSGFTILLFPQAIYYLFSAY